LEDKKGVTAMFNNLVKLVQEEDDLEFLEKNNRGLLMIDKDLAARVFTVPGQ
jgi:ferritin